MTYPEALAYLGDTRRFGMKLGLEPMREMAAALGHPEKELRFIHIAGTNGKGSTAAFCEACLRAAGHRVGLYTSPHLVSVRERIQIDRLPISETDFAEGMEKVRAAVAASAEPSSTFFEIMTGLALWYFARERVDWVVWETGLGGRLDATNIVTPELIIITNIGLDHQQYLGQTLREIATEKAGIIKPGVPVISAVELNDASDVIRKRARRERCALTLVQRDMEVCDLGMRGGRQWARIEGSDIEVSLMGPHQVINAACALEAMRRLRTRGPQPGDELYAVDDAAIARGLKTATWPGRFEVLSEEPLIILDGAHNPAGMGRLVETWRAFLASRGLSNEAKSRLVFASVAEKDITEMAQLLRPLAREVSLVRLASERGAEPETMAEFFPDLPHRFYPNVTELSRDLAAAPADVPILVTGSLFLVGEMLAQGQGSAEEYRLNERLGAALIR